MVVTARELVSEAEFLRLPESMERVELLDGEVVVSPAPTPSHQFMVLEIASRLRTWAREHRPRAFVGLSPSDVRFGPDRILQPDVYLCLAGIDFGQAGPVRVVPDLCVEVLSQNAVYDRVTKREIYASAGVREYWVVQTTGAVERFAGERLSRTHVVTDMLETELLPAFSLSVAELLPR